MSPTSAAYTKASLSTRAKKVTAPARLPLSTRLDLLHNKQTLTGKTGIAWQHLRFQGAVHRVLEPFFAAVRRMRKELDEGFEPWLISKQLAAVKLNQEK